MAVTKSLIFGMDAERWGIPFCFEPQIIWWKTPTEARMWLKDMARESMLSMWPWSTLPRSDSKMFILSASMLILVAMKQTKVYVSVVYVYKLLKQIFLV